MLIKKYFTGSFLFIILFLSCNKKETYNITGDPEVKFFINNTNSGNLPENSFGFNVVNIPDANSSGLLNLSSTFPVSVKFPIMATDAVSKDATIEAKLDTSLVSIFNASHNTNYFPFPAGFLNTDSLVAHIFKGSNISSDSMTVAFNLAALNTLTQQAYLAPVRLTTVSNPLAGKITSNAKTQVVYIVANVETRKIKFLATTADVSGALISPRTSWAVSFNPALSTVGSIIDASTTTYSRWTTPVSPYGQVDVNMQAAKNVTGIRLYTSNSSTYIPTQVDVYVSSDGINYDLVGSPLKANLTYTSSYNYILFYKAIPAKYLRIRLYFSTSTSTSNGRVTELDVYAN